MNIKEYDKLMSDYHKKYGNFMTAFHANDKARWVYLVYGSPDYIDFVTQLTDKRPNHRRIFPDEIVIDIDTDSKRNRETVTKQIKNRLDHLKIEYSEWVNPTGKPHFHLFFPALTYLETGLRLMYKEELMDYLVNEKLMALGKVDHQLVSNTHLIRAEYGFYEKKLLSNSYKELVYTNVQNPLSQNLIPEEVISSVNERLKKKRLLIDIPKAYSNTELPECVKQLLSQDFASLNDGRDRALFFLIWWFRKTSKSRQEWIDRINKYNKYILNNYANDYLLDIKITYSEKNSNRNFAHRYVHNLLSELGVRHGCKCDKSDSFFNQNGDAHDKQFRRTGDGIVG